jgi:hypothetical protein
LYAFLISPMCATTPTHHIFIDLLVLIVFDELYVSNLYNTDQRMILIHIFMCQVLGQLACYALIFSSLLFAGYPVDLCPPS